jgi:hypothetical protein
MKTLNEEVTSWLETINEAKFRDVVLKALFTKLEKNGTIAGFKNVHGTNENGVDFIVCYRDFSGNRYEGIQAKSVKITQTGSGKSLSAEETVRKTERALRHEFKYQNQKIRLSNLSIWTTKDVTDHAENEFDAPGNVVPIKLVRKEKVAQLLIDEVPDIVTSVPGCAILRYIDDHTQPNELSIQILGTKLNPAHHFLEPELTKSTRSNEQNLSRQFRSKELAKGKPEKLSTLLKRNDHLLFVGPELSGKSYLLQKIDYECAKQERIPVYYDFKNNTRKRAAKPEAFISNLLDFLDAENITELSEQKKFVFLCDNIEFAPEPIREALLTCDPRKIQIIGSACNEIHHKSLINYRISGVRRESIPHFLREINRQNDLPALSVDRANSFINRALVEGQIPCNPFTISMILGEFKNDASAFTIPTMGYLIERFAHHQLGSDSNKAQRVDFESKRNFLIRVSTSINRSITIGRLMKLITAYLKRGKHPHKPEDFMQDLFDNGVFQKIENDEKVKWTHPVLRKHFVVLKLLSKDKSEIVKSLAQKGDPQLAAIFGAQIKNADEPLKELLKIAENNKASHRERLISSFGDAIQDIEFPDDQQEEELLSNLEETVIKELDEEETDRTPTPKLTPEAKAAIRKKLEPIFNSVTSDVIHIYMNMAALTINARDTRASVKEDSVSCVISGTEEITGIMRKIILAVLGDEIAIKHKNEINQLSLYFNLEFNDSTLGDPYNVEIFKSLYERSKDISEQIVLLDLLVCCGAENYGYVLEELKKIQRLDLLKTFYMRLVQLYFYRFHKEQDKKAIRKLLKEIRKFASGLPLPSIK